MIGGAFVEGALRAKTSAALMDTFCCCRWNGTGELVAEKILGKTIDRGKLYVNVNIHMRNSMTRTAVHPPAAELYRRHETLKVLKKNENSCGNSNTGQEPGKVYLTWLLLF